MVRKGTFALGFTHRRPSGWVGCNREHTSNQLKQWWPVFFHQTGRQMVHGGLSNIMKLLMGLCSSSLGVNHLGLLDSSLLGQNWFGDPLQNKLYARRWNLWIAITWKCIRCHFRDALPGSLSPTLPSYLASSICWRPCFASCYQNWRANSYQYSFAYLFIYLNLVLSTDRSTLMDAGR